MRFFNLSRAAVYAYEVQFGRDRFQNDKTVGIGSRVGLALVCSGLSDVIDPPRRIWLATGDAISLYGFDI